MTSETVTLQLPEAIYRAARRVAEATHQPLDDVPADQAADLAALALLDDGALWRVARGELESARQAELHDLLNRQSAGELDAASSGRLQELLDAYGRLTVRKAHAYLLLARRGYRVPMQESPDRPA